MAVLQILKAIMVLGCSALVVSRNVAPPAASNEERAVGVNRGSRYASQRRAAPNEARKPPSVPESHVFYDNYRANFSWDDERLQAALGIHKENGSNSAYDKPGGPLVKRAPLGTAQNPLIKVKACAGCLDAAIGIVKSLADLTVEYMESQILLSETAIKNRCVFYTSVPNPFKGPLLQADQDEWEERKTIGGWETHSGLSKIATDYACDEKLVSIWNLWSGKNEVTGGEDDPTIPNYWEVFVEGSWLSFLNNPAEDFYIYFGRMSQAMAKHCGGTVYVMSMRPLNLPKYGYIWGRTEWPALVASYRSKLGAAPTQLISIDAATKKQYLLDFNTQLPPASGVRMLSRGDPGYLDFDDKQLNASMMTKRSTCSDNVAYEPPDQDWFG